jgi:hypothetical protein
MKSDWINVGDSPQKVILFDRNIIDAYKKRNVMAEKLLKVFKSRTFWTLVALFITNGISGIREQLNPAALTTIDAVLGLVATYFHVNPSQNYHE